MSNDLQLIRGVFIVSEVLCNLMKSVEVQHPLHDGGGPQHPALRPLEPLLLADLSDRGLLLLPRHLPLLLSLLKCHEGVIQRPGVNLSRVL